jgi:hypothetical protein
VPARAGRGLDGGEGGRGRRLQRGHRLRRRATCLAYVVHDDETSPTSSGRALPLMRRSGRHRSRYMITFMFWSWQTPTSGAPLTAGGGDSIVLKRAKAIVKQLCLAFLLGRAMDRCRWSCRPSRAPPRGILAPRLSCSSEENLHRCQLTYPPVRASPRERRAPRLQFSRHLFGHPCSAPRAGTLPVHALRHAIRVREVP